MRRATMSSILTLVMNVTSAQPADQPLAFEVASVKPAAPSSSGFRVVMGGDAGRVNYSNVSLKDVIMQAYEVKEYQISGPAWLDSQRFDIIATFPANASKKQVPGMLQALLAERFKLALHHENKDLPGYDLFVAKNGPKLKESPPDTTEAGTSVNSVVIGGGGRGLGGGGGMGGGDGARRKAMTPTAAAGSLIVNGRGHLEGKRQGLPSLANVLAREIGRPVVDATGLTGTFDYVLNWTPNGSDGGQRFRPVGREDGERARGGVREPADADNSAPSLMVAIQQQLGLRLQPRKISVEVLVIDHAERVPTEN